jgi:hypothetical protein
MALDPPLTQAQIDADEIRVRKEALIHRALDGWDQFMASLFAVENDQTISSQVEIDAHKKAWYDVFAKGLNASLDIIQKSHGQQAQVGDITRAEEVIATDEAALKAETGNTVPIEIPQATK